MRRLSLVLLLVLWLVPAAARAVPADRPWATINACKTAGKTNTVGVRAGMPGNGTQQRMFMRFEVQWRDTVRASWRSTGSRSPWISAGSARFRSAQRGYDFDFEDPPDGVSFKLRGVVRFEYRKALDVPGSDGTRTDVVRRSRRVTRGGLEGVRGGRPPGTSEATCVIEGPEPEPTPQLGPEA